MPGRDRTGPQGTGPMTGRGMGYCNDQDQAGFANPPTMLQGRMGLGRRGAGRGWRHRFYATGNPGCVSPAPEQEAADLKAQADWLKTQLDAIQKRIEELAAK